MGAPYSGTTVSGYNSNPPPSDASQTVANEVQWNTIKTKLGDPLNTFAGEVNSAISSAFGKVIGGGGIVIASASYGIVSADQGKLIRVTASGATITTPSATDVAAPFVCAILNNSGGSITVDGNGSQTVDGSVSLSLASGQGVFLFTDGSNWFTAGAPGALNGNQVGYGELLNGTIVESNAANATTYALKSLAGSDPSSADPVFIAFRNVAAATGDYVYRSVTSALSLTISVGSTLGATNGVPFKLWLVLFDDGGTVRLGIVNTTSGTNILPLGQFPIASSTVEGGAGAADSAHVFYSSAAVASKPYIPVAYASYESGLATAGTWNVSPTRIQLYGPGVPLPGTRIQSPANFTGASAGGSTVLPQDNTVPLNTEGDEYIAQAITPTSAANILEIESVLFASNGSGSTGAAALFQGSNVNAIAVGWSQMAATGYAQFVVRKRIVAATTLSSTFRVRIGASLGTNTFNGVGGGQFFGGALASHIIVSEIAV